MPVRMPRSTCKIAHDCTLCPRRVRPGDKMAKDFDSNEWVHLTCMIRKVNGVDPPAWPSSASTRTSG